MTRRLLALGAASLAVLALTNVASAGGLSTDVMTNWTGFYVGGQLGGAWTDTHWGFANPNYFNTLGPDVVVTGFSQDDSGVIGGGQVGFNYQSSAWVFGIEGSMAATDLSDTVPSPFFTVSDRYTMDISWFATVTGRLGYAADRWLFYAEGGWAGADVELDLFDRPGLVRARSDTWADGWTVGGGLEYAIYRNVSLGVEYNYLELDTGRWSLSCPTCGTGVGFGSPVMNGDIEIQSVTGRVNYRFGK